jgi:hypothetical protein
MVNRLTYKDHTLVWYVSHDPATNQWIPEITISWTSGGESQLHGFGAPPQASFDAALKVSRDLAMAWVDDKT